MNGADFCYDLLWICLRNFSAIFKMDYHIWKLTLDSEKLNWTLKILNKCSFPNLIMLPGTWKCTMDPESSPNIVINHPNFSSVIPHFIAITKKEWPFLSKKQSSWKRTLQRHTKIKQWGTKKGLFGQMRPKSIIQGQKWKKWVWKIPGEGLTDKLVQWMALQSPTADRLVT